VWSNAKVLNVTAAAAALVFKLLNHINVENCSEDCDYGQSESSGD
jgi:hypothetical protein